GGRVPANSNIISNNISHGIRISGAGTSGNLVQGNFIGTDVSGAGALGNSGEGVLILDAPGNTIGGTSPGARNVISKNGIDGVSILGGNASGKFVEGNFIGTGVNGAAGLGKHEGGGVILNAPGYTIGRGSPRAGNHTSINQRY